MLKNSAINSLLPFAFAILTAFAVFVLTAVFFQNTTYRVLIKGKFTDDTLVTIYSLSNSGEAAALDSFLISGDQGRKQIFKGTRALNLPLKRLRIDFDYQGQETDVQTAGVRLSQVQVIKPYQNHYYFGGASIAEVFDLERGYQKESNQYGFDKATNRLSIKSKQIIGENNWFLIIGLSILFFGCTLFWARNTVLSRLPAFSDMSLGRHISSSDEFNTINGIRGLAALLVLLSHTAPGFEALQMGLAFLFVISGFLLSKPFVLDNKKIMSWENIERYVTKRIRRILPMYYLYIFLIYVITFKFDTAIRHFFFVQSEGHLWPMTQIFAFYMLLPGVLLISSLSYQVHRLLPIILLALATYFSLSLMNDWKPFYNGQYSHQFFLYAFLLGVLISYVQYDLIGPPVVEQQGWRWKRECLGVIGAILTFYIIAWSAPMKPSPEIFKWVSQFWVKCVVSALIILLVLNTSKSFFQKLMANWLFRSVGVIGFSFYILHGLGMQIFSQIQLQYLGSSNPGMRSWEFMIGAFCVTYIMSVISYSFVERPFFGYKKQNRP